MKKTAQFIMTRPIQLVQWHLDFRSKKINSLWTQHSLTSMNKR